MKKTAHQYLGNLDLYLASAKSGIRWTIDISLLLDVKLKLLQCNMNNIIILYIHVGKFWRPIQVKAIGKEGE